MLRAILDSKGMSLYKLEKESGVSHATLNDIYHEKSNVDNCSVIILSKIAEVLHMSLDELYSTLKYEKMNQFVVLKDFDLFKSNICHDLKRLGDIDFINHVMDKKLIDYYFDDEQYHKALYLLSFIDYLCVKNNIPLIDEYDELREYRLDKIYISGSGYLALETHATTYDNLIQNSNPYFYKHNIVEGDIYDVN